mmetsp:Transcript_24845/g.81737  ORF Transcript_24845/g.81737 Transcript_24845/m.81737 type:complete len:319 (-) Transcript_24845:1445-2401(-)
MEKKQPNVSSSTSGRQQLHQDVIRVLEPLGNVGIACRILEVHRAQRLRPTPVRDPPPGGPQEDFRVVVEGDLEAVVAEAEDDRVPRPHPLPHVDSILCLLRHVAPVEGLLPLVSSFYLARVVEVVLEVPQQRHLLVQLCRPLTHRVARSLVKLDVVPVHSLPLHVLERAPVQLQQDLGRVVKKHSVLIVAQLVPQPILLRVVHPAAHPHLGQRQGPHVRRRPLDRRAQGCSDVVVHVPHRMLVLNGGRCHRDILVRPRRDRRAGCGCRGCRVRPAVGGLPLNGSGWIGGGGGGGSREEKVGLVLDIQRSHLLRHFLGG